MALKNYLVLATLLLFGRWVVAQTLPQEAHFNRYTVNDGLPGNNIYCIEQDDQGFIWIGTDAGLSCFDGVHFTNYFKGADRLHSLPSNFITWLRKLPNGNIVIATRFGLCLLDPVKRSFKSAWIPCEPEMSRAVNSIYPVEATHQNLIVAGSIAGICVFDTALNVVFQYDHFKKEDLNKVSMGFTHDLMALANGDVLVNGWHGLWRYVAAEKRLEKQDPQAFGEVDGVTAFYSAGKENWSVWKQAFPDSLTLRNLQTGKSATTRLNRENKYELHWRSRLRFVNDTLLGFSGHVFGFRTAACDPATLQLRFSKNRIFPTVHFHNFFLDREGRWWLASENGLYVQAFSKSKFRFVSIPVRFDDRDLPIQITCISKAGGYFFAGANREFLVFDQHLKLLKRIVAPPELLFVKDLHHWQPGILEVSGENAWLRLHLPRRWGEPLKWEQVREGVSSLSQVKDLDGNIWMGTYNGVLRLNPSTGRQQFFAEGEPDGDFPFQGALRMNLTDSGYIWMCGLPGFTRWNPFRQQFDRRFPLAPGTERQEGFPCSIVNNGGEEILFALHNNGLWLWSGDAQAARKVETGNPALEIVQEIYPDLHPHRF